MAEVNWQQRATDFAQKRNALHSPSVYALDVMSEVGEVAKALLLATEYGKRPFQPQNSVSLELGDALYSLCLLASAAEVDLEQALTAVLAKYERRWQEHGALGSQSSL